MPYRLTFVADRYQEPLEAEDEAGILDAWNDLPWWRAWEPANFRQNLVEFSGAKIDGGMPAADEEILPAVVSALGPDDVKLEKIKALGVGGRIRRAVSG